MCSSAARRRQPHPGGDPTLDNTGTPGEQTHNTFGCDAMNRQTAGNNQQMTQRPGGWLHALLWLWMPLLLTRGATHQEQYRYDVLGRLVDTTIARPWRPTRTSPTGATRRASTTALGAPWPATSPMATATTGPAWAGYTVYDSLGRQWLNRQRHARPRAGPQAW